MGAVGQQESFQDNIKTTMDKFKESDHKVRSTVRTPRARVCVGVRRLTHEYRRTRQLHREVAGLKTSSHNWALAALTTTSPRNSSRASSSR